MIGAGRDEAYMRRALALAARGRGRVRPNPMVGAVVVHGGRVVGKAGIVPSESPTPRSWRSSEPALGRAAPRST